MRTSGKSTPPRTRTSRTMPHRATSTPIPSTGTRSRTPPACRRAKYPARCRGAPIANRRRRRGCAPVLRPRSRSHPQSTACRPQRRSGSRFRSAPPRTIARSGREPMPRSEHSGLELSSSVASRSRGSMGAAYHGEPCRMLSEKLADSAGWHEFEAILAAISPRRRRG